jgi:hypothetical protein
MPLAGAGRIARRLRAMPADPREFRAILASY